MNAYQRLAFENPCRLGIEAGNPKFGHMEGRFFSVVLSLDSGYE